MSMNDLIERAVVLFGHGARDPQWAEPMERTRARLCDMTPGLAVELAYLELMRPTLAEAIERLVAGGASRITVVPMFLAAGGHLKRDLPALIEAERARHPACEITQAPALGEADEMVTAMARYARECALGRDG